MTRDSPGTLIRDRGYVWIVVLFTLLILMSAGLLVAAALHRQSVLYLQERRDVQLTAMLDGALAKALAHLWQDPDYSGTSEPFASGTITIATKKIDGLNVEVTVKAEMIGGGLMARARVRIDRRPPEQRKPPRVLSWEPVRYERRSDLAGKLP